MVDISSLSADWSLHQILHHLQVERRRFMEGYKIKVDEKVLKEQKITRFEHL